MKRQLLVKVTFEIPIEWEHSPLYCTDDHIKFCIEDNGCPGTGIVGLAIESLMELHESQSTCWACSVKGVNEILSIGPMESANESATIP